MKLLPTLLCSVIIVSIASCSIKEDRSECPCVLTVTLHETTGKVMISGWSDGRRIINDILKPDDKECTAKYRVPRDRCGISAFRGYEELVLSNDVLLIPEGSQMSCLYACASVIDTDSETAVYKVNFKKNHVKVNLSFRNSDTELCPYDIQVRGTVAGIEMKTLSPVRGNFVCTSETNDGKGYEFVIPRQIDESLSIDLMRGNEKYDTIALGRIIASAGYDWTADELADIDLVIDLPRGEISITVSGWDGPYSTTVTI